MKLALPFVASVLAVAFGSAFTACGSDMTSSGNGADGGTGRDSSLNGGKDSGEGPGDGDAAIDDADLPETCAAESADANVGVFVDGASGADASCGSLAKPCKSIGAGIDAANVTSGKTIVYVAVGAYAESINLAGKKLVNGALRIEGGWRSAGGAYTRACASVPRAGVIVVATQNVVVDARDLDGALTLQTLTLKSKTAAAGESLYGVFARGAAASVTLDDVALDIAVGGAGALPLQPAQPTQAGTSCPGGTGLPGAAAAPTAGVATASTYSAAGYALGKGPDGNAGNPGSNGKSGDVTTITGLNCDFDTCVGAACTSTSTSGPNGCAGAKGLAGGGGFGGGASIGIYAWDATVTVGTTDIAVAGGGVGGAGGTGGLGGLGGPGGAGTAGGPCGTSCVGLPPPPELACKTMNPRQAQANPGGAAGAGSNGSNGGPGPGGDAYCTYKGDAAKLNVSQLQCAAGPAGNGGAGVPAAPAGKSAPSN